MKLFLHIASIAILAIASAASTAFAQTTANGPYYATPSWNQTLPASTRFIVLSNMGGEAVLDRETGLVWERVPRSTNRGSWGSAVEYCLVLNKGGRMGWRLAAMPELMSIVDRSQSNPSLPAGHPFTVPPAATLPFYWVATTEVRGPDSAYIVDFRDGSVAVDDKNLSNGFPWCVRGGSGGDYYFLLP